VRCPRCQQEIDPRQLAGSLSEKCWVCEASMCVRCWLDRGECGHPEVEADDDYSRLLGWNAERPQA